MINVLVNTSGERDPWLQSSRTFAMVIRILLEAVVQIDLLYLQTHKVPPLYSSGVKYRNEPRSTATLGAERTKPIEEFATIPAMLERGWGDCDDLGPWRCAELRNAGEPAKMRVVWVKVNGQKKFHVVVRRANGHVEDPSHLLGMPLSVQGHNINVNAR